MNFNGRFSLVHHRGATPGQHQFAMSTYRKGFRGYKPQQRHRVINLQANRLMSDSVVNVTSYFQRMVDRRDVIGVIFSDQEWVTKSKVIALAVAVNDAHRFLRYTDLRSFVSAAVPQSERFVLIAESFSTPLAVSYAASNPLNLDAVVIGAGFVGNLYVAGREL